MWAMFIGHAITYGVLRLFGFDKDKANVSSSIFWGSLFAGSITGVLMGAFVYGPILFVMQASDASGTAIRVFAGAALIASAVCGFVACVVMFAREELSKAKPTFSP